MDGWLLRTALACIFSCRSLPVIGWAIGHGIGTAWPTVAWWLASPRWKVPWHVVIVCTHHLLDMCWVSFLPVPELWRCDLHPHLHPRESGQSGQAFLGNLGNLGRPSSGMWASWVGFPRESGQSGQAFPWNLGNLGRLSEGI